MRINHNISALNAWRQLTATQYSMSKTLERLSSGFKINRAGDDAAGLAISEKMRGQIRGLNMAIKNAQDGISLIQTAEGALQEVHSILQRMRELAVQAANDTNTDEDREAIQLEIDQLKEEIDRIALTTEFNTKKLLDGSLGNKVDIITDPETRSISSAVLKTGAIEPGRTEKVEIDVVREGTADVWTMRLVRGLVVNSVLTGQLDANAANYELSVLFGVQTSGVKITVAQGTDKSFTVEIGSGWKLGDLIQAINDGAREHGMFVEAYFVTGEGIRIRSTRQGSYYSLAITEDWGAISTSGQQFGFAPVDETYIYDVDTPSAAADALPELFGITSNYSLAIVIGVGSRFAVAYVPEDAISVTSTANNITSVESRIEVAIANTLLSIYSGTTADWLSRVVVNVDTTTFRWDIHLCLMYGNNIESNIINIGNMKIYGLSVIASTGASNVVWSVFKQGGAPGSRFAGAEGIPAGGWTNVILDHGDDDPYGLDYVLSITNMTTLQTYSRTAWRADDVDIYLSNIGIYDAYDSVNNQVILNINIIRTGETEMWLSSGNIKLHIGANEFQNMDVSIGSVKTNVIGRNAEGETPEGVQRASQFTDGVTQVEVTTQEKAEDTIITVDKAIQEVSQLRANLGAYQNRLEHTIANLGVAAENLTAAESRIRDADMAKEMMEFTKQQILLQSSMAMLAQANAQPQNVLQLLR